MINRQIQEEMKKGQIYSTETLAAVLDSDGETVHYELSRMADEGVVERVDDPLTPMGVSWRLTED